MTRLPGPGENSNITNKQKRGSQLSYIDALDSEQLDDKANSFPANSRLRDATLTEALQLTTRQLHFEIDEIAGTTGAVEEHRKNKT